MRLGRSCVRRRRADVLTRGRGSSSGQRCCGRSDIEPTRHLRLPTPAAHPCRCAVYTDTGHTSTTHQYVLTLALQFHKKTEQSTAFSKSLLSFSKRAQISILYTATGVKTVPQRMSQTSHTPTRWLKFVKEFGVFLTRNKITINCSN